MQLFSRELSSYFLPPAPAATYGAYFAWQYCAPLWLRSKERSKDESRVHFILLAAGRPSADGAVFHMRAYGEFFAQGKEDAAIRTRDTERVW